LHMVGIFLSGGSLGVFLSMITSNKDTRSAIGHVIILAVARTSLLKRPTRKCGPWSVVCRMYSSVQKSGTLTRRRSEYDSIIDLDSTLQKHSSNQQTNGFTIPLQGVYSIQCSPANPAQAGEEAVGLADLSGSTSCFCVLVGEWSNI